ncbi:MAG: DUF2269 family protein [Ignavibacteria bacterium]|nr:DUF2269 family protein [Ignavibacteria bacterium]
MVYLYLKLIHVLFVILFLGNITVGVFWKVFAQKTKDPDKIAFAFKGIIKADKYFTMPGVIGITLFGIGGAIHGGFPILGTGWILWSIILFSISGISFMAKLAPLQKQIAALASDKEKFNWDEYHKLAKQWDFWGFIALAAPFIAVILMVLKPNI